MDLAFQQTKYWGLLFLHIGNTVVNFLPGPSIIEVYFACFNQRLPNYLIYRFFKYVIMVTLNTLSAGKVP